MLKMFYQYLNILFIISLFKNPNFLFDFNLNYNKILNHNK